jgi:acyl carrier protein
MSSFNELQKVIAVFFHVNPELITVTTTAHDIEDWDSFNHMELISTIETYFNVKIPFVEIMEFNKVGDIQSYLNSTKA